MTPDAPAHLQANISAQIQRATIHRIRLEAGIASLATLALAGYVTFFWSDVWLEIQESSFFQLIRLGFSDPDIVFANFQETAWSLIETVPIQSLVLGLGLVLCLTFVIGFLLRLREVRQAVLLRPT